MKVGESNQWNNSFRAHKLLYFGFCIWFLFVHMLAVVHVAVVAATLDACNIAVSRRHHLRVEVCVAEGQIAHQRTGIVYRDNLHH